MRPYEIRVIRTVPETKTFSENLQNNQLDGLFINLLIDI